MTSTTLSRRFFKLAVITAAVGVFAYAAAGILSSTVFAKKGGNGGGRDGGSHDIPICVTVDDSLEVRSDGAGDYCHSKRAKVEAFVGRSGGRFYLLTNVNGSPTGRTMNFLFPTTGDGSWTEVFGDMAVPGGLMPKNVWSISARGSQANYVDLRTMTPGTSVPISIGIELERDGQNKVRLHYGDPEWPSGHPGGAPATIVGGPDTDSPPDGYSDSWTISGNSAWMTEIVDNDYNNQIPRGEVAISFCFEAVKK